MRLFRLITVLSGVFLITACEAKRQATADGTQAAPASSRLSELLSADAGEGYALALEPREFSFPRDHGPHPEYRNEWWYVTGNLDGAGGERFGFELTFFRFALAPSSPAVEDPSSWRTRQVYIGHFAITDAERGEFHVADRYARGALGLAGAEAAPFRVWLEDWFIKQVGQGTGLAESDRAEGAAQSDTWLLHAAFDDLALTLSLDPLKPPVLNGADGLSQKSSEPGNASYYYSLPRLEAAGTLAIPGGVYDVTGLAWMDREWGSSALASDQAGWDWFALQFDDGSELMFYDLRRLDGSRDPHSAGTWIPADGAPAHLGADEVAITVRDTWASPRGGTYPAAWTLEIAALDLVVDVDPVMQAQELATTVRYWEGAVDAVGERAGNEVSGRGYVELTGYAD